MTGGDAPLAITEDAALGGRIRLRQPRRGHRFGHDAILLAAAVDARAGQCAVDLGAGVGAAGLALAARVPGLRVVLVEIVPELARLALDNVALNAMGDRVSVVRGDVAAPALGADVQLAPGCADHVLMNPPFNDPDRQNLSPDARRRLAHAGGEAILPDWLATADRLLAPHGRLTMIWRADRPEAVISMVADKFGRVSVLPILPRPGSEPIRMIIAARRGGRAAMRRAKELVLQGVDGKPSVAAEQILREAGALPIAVPDGDEVFPKSGL